MAEDRFRLLFEHSSDAHFIIIEGRITDCNAAAVQLLRAKSRDEVLKLHPAELSPDFQPDGELSLEKSAHMDHLARERGFHRFEWMHRKIDGEEFPVMVTLNALTIDGRDALIAVWHDLTDIKETENKLRRANEYFKKELEAAAMVQQAMLPISSPRVKGFRAGWAFKPSGDLGGDILNVFPLDEKHVGLYVLDVTGHGVAASLLSVAASHFLSPYSEASFVRGTKSASGTTWARPAEVAEKLNRHFSSHPDVIQLFTLLYGVINVESLEFCYVCAGHPLPIVVSRGGKARQAQGSGMPIGVEQDFEYSEICLPLKPGDRLYIYSDGVTEARNDSGEMFGDERLIASLSEADAEPVGESTERIAKAVFDWCKPGLPEDDVTVLSCELTPCRP